MKRAEAVRLLKTGEYILAYDSVCGRYSLKKRSLTPEYFERINYKTGVDLKRAMKQYVNGVWSTIQTYDKLPSDFI